jgi:hypothetical protein
MTTTFKPEELTDYDDQKGANITLDIDGHDAVFSVWIDVLDEDNTTLRIIQDFEDDILVHTVEAEDFTLPNVTYSEEKVYCYVTFNHYAVHIKLDDEGVCFDVWDSTDDEDGAADTTYIEFDELRDEEDEDLQDDC